MPQPGFSLTQCWASALQGKNSTRDDGRIGHEFNGRPAPCNTIPVIPTKLEWSIAYDKQWMEHRQSIS
jgi:hypothetical protein